MAENDTPHSKPDLAEGSMAFMPTPDGVKAPEGEISLKHDKQAEKKSIAEFTDHIAGEEPEKPTKDSAKVVPVRLGRGEKEATEAKHAPENSDAPIKLAKSKTAKPLIEASVMEEPAH
ncbi:hypothetical protein KBC99_02395, partial [Candidatus Saccharibacteria bacterium]|nr:hypothetical protein [Candidatus Saccharibacteria bacterium]